MQIFHFFSWLAITFLSTSVTFSFILTTGSESYLRAGLWIAATLLVAVESLIKNASELNYLAQHRVRYTMSDQTAEPAAGIKLCSHCIDLQARSLLAVKKNL